MKIARTFLALLLTLAAGVGYSFAQGTDIKAAYVKDGEIFTIGADGQERRLTDDGIANGGPLWSKDGTKIAFSRKIDRAVALADLVVVDPENGRTLADIRICPVTPDTPEVQCGMNYVERIEWLTADKIAAAASINPSTDDTLVFDLRAGKVLMDYTDDYTDDHGGAVFSPDGEHVAAETGAPHWTPDWGSAPELDIGYQRVYPAKGVHVTLLSQAAWSDDGKEVAVVAEDYKSKRRSIVVCGLKGACESTALPAGKWDPDESYQIQWNGGRVYATAPEGTWSCQRGDSIAVVSSPPPDLKGVATGLTAGLREQIQNLGGKEPDFWCADCALAKLPRQAPED
jgi:WD40-like Beta Propeller Repeat